MINKKKQNRDAKIPDSGMSDIVFLLLLFFLVSTTIDVDTGIGIVLPEYQENPDDSVVPISKDRLVAILVNENGDVMMNGEPMALPRVKEKLMEKIQSKIGLPKNKKLVVSVKTDRRTNYNLYVQTLDQARMAYSEVRDAYSQTNFGSAFADLQEEQANIVKDEIPMTISIAEPEKIK